MTRKSMHNHRMPILAVFIALAVGACEGAIPPHLDPHSPPPGQVERVGTHDSGSVLGEDGLDLTKLFGSGGNRTGEGSGIGVNAYLWRASLDVIAFLPLASADPFGGVIITDWYAPPDTPNERLKANIYILGRELRTDGIRVSVFRQSRASADAPWQDATVAPETNTGLEDRILSRAREIRTAARAGVER